MRKENITFITACLLLWLAVGCSTTQRSHEVNLGVVDLKPDAPKQLTLPYGATCTLVPGMVPSAPIEVQLLVLRTNAQGQADRLQAAVKTPPGHKCGLAVEDLVVFVTPTISTKP